jgi:hypothetical protein
MLDVQCAAFIPIVRIRHSSFDLLFTLSSTANPPITHTTAAH